MGLFDKKYCDICNEKIGLLGNRKLEDGNLCKDCARKLSPWFSDRRSSTVQEISEQLAYREENRNKVAQFRVTRSYGEDMKVLIDEQHRWLMVTRARDLTEANPDVMDFSALVDCTMDISDYRSEVTRTDKDGKRISYNPPRYEYRYDFNIIIRVNTPYFDEIKFRLNEYDIRIVSEAPGTVGIFGRSASIDPSYNVDYRKYMHMGEEMCDALRGLNSPAPMRDGFQRGYGEQGHFAPGNMQDTMGNKPIHMMYSETANVPPAQAAYGGAAAAPSAEAWSCPSCGSQNTGKFCNNCGSPKPAARIGACPSCGHVVPTGAPTPKFCPECGAPLSGRA